MSQYAEARMNDMRASLKQQNSSPWLMHEE